MNLKKRKMKKNFSCKFSFPYIDMYSIQISSLIYKVICIFRYFTIVSKIRYSNQNPTIF